MDYLELHQELPSDRTTMIAAFAGWTNAGEAATRAVRYMARRLSTERVASIDSEEFFNFTQVRPYVNATPDGNRVIYWPSNDFFTVDDETTDEKLLLFNGTEPSLKWRTYTELVLDTAEKCGVKQIVTLGASLAATPHTRTPIISGTTTDPRWQEMLAEWGILRQNRPTYQGPTGISSAIREAATERGIPYVSLMSRVPHYLQAPFNPPVTQALLNYVCRMLGVTVDLTRLETRSEDFRQQADQLIREEEDMAPYVRQLEEEYDSSATTPQDLPQPEDADPTQLVEDLEDFLRRERGDDSEN